MGDSLGIPNTVRLNVPVVNNGSRGEIGKLNTTSSRVCYIHTHILLGDHDSKRARLAQAYHIRPNNPFIPMNKEEEKRDRVMTHLSPSIERTAVGLWHIRLHE